MIKRGVLIIFVILFLSSITSALTVCDETSISVTFEQGDSVPVHTISCTNQGNETATLTKIGSFFSTNPTTPIAIDSQETKDIDVSFNENYPPGIHEGAILFSDETATLNIMATIEEQSQSPSGIIIFPTSQVTTVQQGQQKQKNIVISVPSDYGEPITIQAVNFNPDLETIIFGDLSLGQVSPGQSVQIPIIYSGLDAQAGTYQTTLNVLATDSQGQIDLPNVNLQLQVTSGISPVGGNQTRPSCSLSATTMNLNNTYSLTCSGVTSNIDVNVPYNDYFQGISPVEVSSGILTYSFKPIKYGVTNFIAYFSNMNLPIFEPFIQEVTISSTGAGLPGTVLKLLFTPSLENAQPGEDVIVQVVDNKTNSLVVGSQLFVDTNQIIPNGYNFPFTFEAGENYNFRAVATGYNDLVQDVNLSRPIEISVSPESGTSSTSFTINTSINSSLFINGQAVDNPYNGFLSEGLNEIRAISQGYTDGFKNITIDPSLRLTLSTEFKKNTNQIWTLNKNVSWQLFYRGSDGTEVITSQGEGDTIEFIPDKKGFYYIKVDDKIVGSEYEVTSQFNWLWLIAGVAVLAIGLFIYSRNRENEVDSNSPGWASGGPIQNSDYDANINMGDEE